MEGNIAATYTLIYCFLKQQSQHKAAEAVKKAAKAIVVLRDDTEQEGPSLEDIIKEWKTKENTKSGNTGSSSKDSDSSDDSSSDSEDSSSSSASSEDTSDSESEDDDASDDSDDSDETTTTKKLPPKAERDTSATLSSAGENAQGIAKQVVQIPKKSTENTDKATKDKNKGSESDSSDPDSSDSDSSLKSPASDSSDAESSSNGPSSSSSSDSSDEDEANANKKAPPNRANATEGKSASTSESSSESEDDSDSEQEEDTQVTKKRKTSENGAAVTTAVAAGSRQIARASQGKEKAPPNVKERFQRVKVQNLAPELFLNNGYEAKGGTANDYGGRAHRDLVVTRGAGFRKEKNKKKRGSYRGGEITMENHSIKFDF